MANPQYSLSVTEGTELQLSLLGPQGPQGPAGANGAPGPNEVTTATTTNITGLLKGNGSTVLAATVGTDYQAPLVSGTNIKTVNGTSILGSGDIDTDPDAQTWPSENPNIPENIILLADGVTHNMERLADENNYPFWYLSAGAYTNFIKWTAGTWEIKVTDFDTAATLYQATKTSDEINPAKLTAWTVDVGTEQPSLTGDNPTGDYLGQLLQASDDSWWRWNGTSWERDLTYADVSTTHSSGKVILWGSSADATLTNLGGGTAGKAIFGAATATGTGDPVLATSPTITNATMAPPTDTGVVALTVPDRGIIDLTDNFAGNVIKCRISSGGVFLRGDKSVNFSVNSNSSTADTFISKNTSVSGQIQIGTSIGGTQGSIELTNLIASGTVTAGTYTYAQLIALTPAAGARAFCSDSDTTASGNFASTFAGTGANFVPCYYDGSNWRIG